MAFYGQPTRVIGGLLAVGVAVRLAWWQWERGQGSGRLLHYTYAGEWLLVSVLLLVVVLRRGRRRRTDDGDGAARDVAGRVVGPPLRAGDVLPESVRDRVLRRLRLRSRSAR